jgi:thioester reductase-like protein
MKILLTGVTGLIGAELADRLQRAGHAVVGLRRRDSQVLLSNKRPLSTAEFVDRFEKGVVQLVRGDVAEPLLGLAPELYRCLLNETEFIVHSAAVTEFGHPAAIYERTNVSGTENVLQMATGRRQIPLLYVSTAYVCGVARGRISENKLHLPRGFGNAYEESKFRAESRVRAQGLNGLPYVIVRPSIVVGASDDGRIREFKNIYRALKVITKGKVSSIPGKPAALLDLVPWDYVCDVMVAIMSRPEQWYGTTFQAVGRQPLMLQDFSDVIAEYPSLKVPRFVPPESFIVDALPTSERRYYRQIVSLFETYFVRQMEFSYDNTARLMNGHLPPPARTFLRRILNYGEKVGFLATTEPALTE